MGNPFKILIEHIVRICVIPKLSHRYKTNIQLSESLVLYIIQTM